MIALRIAALISAVATIVLNAHYGWTSSSVLFYAAMMATLSVAFDVAKCSLLSPRPAPGATVPTASPGCRSCCSGHASCTRCTPASARSPRTAVPPRPLP